MIQPLSGNGNKVNFLLPNVNTRQVTCREESAPPVYVKHGYPEVFKQKSDYYDYLPKISQLPGAEAEETYGLMYHKPETDAEIKMHDLWVARRRQEVNSHRKPLEFQASYCTSETSSSERFFILHSEL